MPPDTDAALAYSDHVGCGIVYIVSVHSGVTTDTGSLFFASLPWKRRHAGGERDELLVVGAPSVDDQRTVTELAGDLPDVEHVDACVCVMTVRRLLRMDLSASDPREMSVSLHTGGLR